MTSKTIYGCAPIQSSIDGKFHYVYRITNLVENKHYYSRSSILLPKTDMGLKYFGSPKNNKWIIQDQKDNPLHYKYKILSCFITKKEAIVREARLHKIFNVRDHKLFYNEQNQTSDGFISKSGGKWIYNEKTDHQCKWYEKELPDGYIFKKIKRKENNSSKGYSWYHNSISGEKQTFSPDQLKDLSSDWKKGSACTFNWYVNFEQEDQIMVFSNITAPVGYFPGRQIRRVKAKFGQWFKLNDEQKFLSFGQKIHPLAEIDIVKNKNNIASNRSEYRAYHDPITGEKRKFHTTDHVDQRFTHGSNIRSTLNTRAVHHVVQKKIKFISINDILPVDHIEGIFVKDYSKLASGRGKIWITNETRSEEQKILQTDLIPHNWKRGRKLSSKK